MNFGSHCYAWYAIAPLFERWPSIGFACCATLVDELSDGAECDFRNRLAEYFRAIWFWLNFDEKRQRTQQQNAHISADRHLVGYGDPCGLLQINNAFLWFANNMAASPKVSQNPNNSESYSPIQSRTTQRIHRKFSFPAMA